MVFTDVDLLDGPPVIDLKPYAIARHGRPRRPTQMWSRPVSDTARTEVERRRDVPTMAGTSLRSGGTINLSSRVTDCPLDLVVRLTQRVSSL